LAEKTFGTTLRELRKAAGLQTIAEFAALLQLNGLNYTVEAVGYWERNARTPNRDILLTVCELLAGRSGMTNLEQMNGLLDYAGMNDLSEGEITARFPQLDHVDSIPNSPICSKWIRSPSRS